MSFPLFFFLLSLFVSACIAADYPSIFSTNTTLVQVGQPFTAKCTVIGSPPKGKYGVYIEKDGGDIIDYNFEAESSGSPRQPQITLNPNHFTDGIRSLFANTTTVEALVTPTSLGVHKYFCGFVEPEQHPHHSNAIPITVVEYLPSPTFSANISKPQVGVPFTVTCNLTQFSPSTASNYSVAFFSKRDGLLATYEIEGGSSLLSVKLQSRLTQSAGTRTSFPAFDLTLVEHQDSKQEYWCALEVPKLGVIESAHWTGELTPTFTSSSPNSGSPNTRLGTCSLDNFTTAPGTSYSVQFSTTHGPASVNLLALYSVNANQILEFYSRQVSGWSEITHGPKHSFPTFSILATANSSLSGDTWWCTFSIQTGGESGNGEFPSKKIDLS